MDGIGGIHRGCPPGQLHNVALGRENVNLIREQIHLYAFNKFQGIAGPLLHFQQPLNPFPRPGMGCVGGPLFRLVKPVGRYAIVGHVLHFPGANLYFNWHAVHAFQDGVKRLVAIGLGDRNVVGELSRHRFVQAVDYAQNAITVVYGVDDDAKRKYVHDLGKGFALGFHLGIDAVKVLLPANDFTAEVVP